MERLCPCCRSVGLSALAILAACGVAGAEPFDSGQPRRPSGRLGGADSAPTTTWTWASGCLGEGAEPGAAVRSGPACAGITITTSGSEIVLRHAAARLNCCAEVSLSVQRSGDTIRFREHEAGELCRCVCPYDLEAGIGGLEPGGYKVEVLGVDGALLCERQVQVGPGNLGVVASGCLGKKGAGLSNGSESVEMSAEGNRIVIHHRGAHLNCCLELEVVIVSNPGYYRVVEHDRGAPCYCECDFDFVIMIANAASGEHLVELVGVDGATLASEVVTVP